MAFRAARAGGEEVVLGPYLVGRGLVSVSVLLQLSAEAKDVSEDDVSAELSDAGFGLADDSSSAEALPPDESAGERIRLVDPSNDGGDGGHDLDGDGDPSDETDPRGARADASMRPAQCPVSTSVCTGNRRACRRRIIACTRPTVSTACRKTASPVPRSESDSSRSWFDV